jgi:hypothetical protein
VYGGTLTGPAQTFSYDYGNQSAAVDMLLSGVLMDATTTSGVNASPASTTTPPPTASTTADGKHQSNAGAIAGGVVGALIVLSMIVTLVILIIRQRRRRVALMTPAEPFMATSHDSPHPATTQSEYFAQLKQSLNTRGVATEPPSFSPVSTAAEEDGQRITIGSLIWELNELLRRGNRSAREEVQAGPPAYTSP